MHQGPPPGGYPPHPPPGGYPPHPPPGGYGPGPYGPGGYGSPGGFGPGGYGPGGYGPPPGPPPSNNTLLYVLLAVGVVLVLGFAGCGALLFLAGREDSATSAKPAVTSPAGASTTAAPPALARGGRKTHARQAFSFDYPERWTLQTGDDDYDPDALMTVDSPGACHTQIQLVEPSLEASRMTAIYEDKLGKTMLQDPKRATFSRWGSFQGAGVELAGPMLGHEGSIRIFSHRGKRRAFTIIEFCFDDEMAATKPGFTTIESSFKLL